MSEKKTQIKVLSVEYIEIKPTLTTTRTNTLIQGFVNGHYVLTEVDHKVEDADEVKQLLLEASKKPADQFKGLEWEVE